MELAISPSILYGCVNSYLESSNSRAAGAMAKNVFILCRREICFRIICEKQGSIDLGKY